MRKVFVGVDVSKDKLDISLSNELLNWSVKNVIKELHFDLKP